MIIVHMNTSIGGLIKANNMNHSTQLSRCNQGNHELEVIYKSNVGWNETNVVRWCKYCGAVVVDTDSDNRTYAGNIMKMRIPSYNT